MDIISLYLCKGGEEKYKMLEHLPEIIIAFLIAALSGLGVGSAGLLVVWLVSAGGLEQLAAQGVNLYFFLFSSSSSLLVHLRRRKILWGAVLLMSAFGIIGALIGTGIATRADPALLRRLFGFMLLGAGGLSLFRGITSFGKKGRQGRNDK